MREKIEYFIVRFLLSIAKVLPKGVLYKLFRYLTLLVYHLDKKRRNLTITNLKMALNLDEEDAIKLSKDVYIELSKTITEIVLMFVDRFDIDSAIINKDEAIAKIDKLLANSPNGIIAMTAHFSNWELLAQFLARHGLKMMVVGREGNNKLIEHNITTPLRRKYGNDTVYKHKAMMAMFKTLKKGGNVGILIDQKAKKNNNSVMVNFFGQSASTTTVVAMLKQKFDPLVVPFFVARESDGRYNLIIQDAIESNCQDDSTKCLEEMTQSYNDAMQEVISRYPSQWFWMHNRWRL
jgi:KDO2-lipid IV(A) lauroyltransferase